MYTFHRIYHYPKLFDILFIQTNPCKPQGDVDSVCFSPKSIYPMVLIFPINVLFGSSIYVFRSNHYKSSNYLESQAKLREILVYSRNYLCKVNSFNTNMPNRYLTENLIIQWNSCVKAFWHNHVVWNLLSSNLNNRYSNNHFAFEFSDDWSCGLVVRAIFIKYTYIPLKTSEQYTQQISYSTRRYNRYEISQTLISSHG